MVVQLAVRVCDVSHAESAAVIIVNASGVVAHLPSPMRRGGQYYVHFDVPAVHIDSVELRTDSSDGLCVAALTLEDRAMTDGMLPVWLDDPCQGFHTITWGSGVHFSGNVFVTGEDAYPCASSMTWHVGEPPRPMQCTQCHNSARCGVCLELLDAAYCPLTEVMATMTQCHASEVAMGALCEGDGECGTDEGDNTCGSHEVYRRVACNDGAALPLPWAPLPPFAPLPSVPLPASSPSPAPPPPHAPLLSLPARPPPASPPARPPSALAIAPTPSKLPQDPPHTQLPLSTPAPSPTTSAMSVSAALAMAARSASALALASRHQPSSASSATAAGGSGSADAPATLAAARDRGQLGGGDAALVAVLVAVIFLGGALGGRWRRQLWDACCSAGWASWRVRRIGAERASGRFGASPRGDRSARRGAARRWTTGWRELVGIELEQPLAEGEAHCVVVERKHEQQGTC